MENTLCVAPVGQRKAQQLNFSYFSNGQRARLALNQGPGKGVRYLFSTSSCPSNKLSLHGYSSRSRVITVMSGTSRSDFVISSLPVIRALG